MFAFFHAQLRRLARLELLLLPLALVCVWVILKFDRLQHEQAEKNLIDNERHELDVRVDRFRSDIYSYLKYIDALSLSLDHQPADLESFIPATKMFLSANSKVFQFRVIDAQGMETIRFERSGQKVELLASEQLQDKADRYYTKESLKLTEGAFYISPIDLNVEQGVVQQPYVPTIRISRRLAHDAGFLIANIDLSSELNLLRQNSDDMHLLWAIDREGYWLVGPNDQQEWAFMFGNEDGVKTYWPAEISSDILGTPRNNVIDDNGILLTEQLDFANITNQFPISSQARITFLANYPPQYVQQTLSGASFTSAFTLIGLVLFSFGLIGWVMMLLRRRNLKQSLHDREQETLQDVMQSLEQEILERTDQYKSTLDFLRTITEHTPSAIIYWDNLLKCRYFNHSLEAQMVSGDTPLRDGVAAHSIFNDEHWAILRGYFDSALAGKTGQYLLSAQHDSGAYDIELFFIPCQLKNDEKGVLLIGQDVTDIKASERNIYQLNQELKEKTEAANQAAAAKSAFLANMSHEIRTPMNGVLGMLSLLKGTDMAPQQKDYADKAYHSSVRLLRILNDILDLSRFDAGQLQLNFADFELESLIQDSVDVFAVTAEDKKIDLQVSVSGLMPLTMTHDQLRLGQVISNLVGNALKFTPEHGSVNVSFDVMRLNEEGFELEIKVRDSGIGMSQAQMDVVFKEFTQADGSITRRFGGTGLGLSICKRLVELMKGKIEVVSEEGKGACFTVLLPVQRIKLDDFSELPIDQKALVVVSDNARIYHVLEQHSHQWGLSLSQMTHQDKEAIERVAVGEHRVLFLIDLSSGQLISEAITLITLIRANAQQGIVIVVPASMSVSDRAMLNAQSVILITQPVTPSRLYNVLLNANHLLNSELSISDDLPAYALTALVVDDLAINREVVAGLLVKTGIKVIQASSGQEALSCLQTQSVDLVLMDIHMDEMSGLEATQAIRALPLLPQPLIFGLSASVLDQDRLVAIQSGMDDYVFKPFILKDFLKTLAQHGIKPSEHQAASSSELTSTSTQSVDKTSWPDFINYHDLLRRMDGDATLVQLCIASFINEFAGCEDQLRQLIDKKNITALKSMAHKIKGSAWNIGDSILADVAMRVENGTDAECFEQSPALLECFSAHFTILLSQIGDDRLSSTLPSVTENARTPVDGLLIDQLRGLLHERHFIDSEIKQRFLDHLRTRGWGEEAQMLNKALSLFEFDQAIALLDRLESTARTND